MNIGVENRSVRSLGSLVLCAVTLLATAEARANSFTATIDALQADKASGGVYVRLTGTPTFNGGNCSGIWAAGDMNDEKFMIYIWPSLLAAKTKGLPITINVTGCLGTYTQITWVQINGT